MELELEDAVEVVLGQRPDPPLFVCCEHASERLPEPWQWPEADHWLMGTHWAYDIGAAELTRELATSLGVTAVLARFSRLLADPNRDEGSGDMFLSRAEGREVLLNSNIDEVERERRLAQLWRPYHSAVDRELSRTTAPIVLAVHTFTPVWQGESRDVEVGVLFDEEEALAERAREAISRAGLFVAMNEPYSGRAGLIYSAQRHALAHNRRAIELEVRQDLAARASVRSKVVAALGSLSP